MQYKEWHELWIININVLIYNIPPSYSKSYHQINNEIERDLLHVHVLTYTGIQN